jgi:hypothetical protein
MRLIAQAEGDLVPQNSRECWLVVDLDLSEHLVLHLEHVVGVEEGAVGVEWRSPKAGALPGCAMPRHEHDADTRPVHSQMNN